MAGPLSWQARRGLKPNRRRETSGWTRLTALCGAVIWSGTTGRTGDSKFAPGRACPGAETHRPSFLDHVKQNERDRRADETDDGFADGPGLERLWDRQTEALLHDPESGVVQMG